jgi:hypothetical protein
MPWAHVVVAVAVYVTEVFTVALFEGEETWTAAVLFAVASAVSFVAPPPQLVSTAATRSTNIARQNFLIFLISNFGVERKRRRTTR